MVWARTTTGTDEAVGYIESGEVSLTSLNIASICFSDSSSFTTGSDYVALWVRPQIIITAYDFSKVSQFKYFTDSYRFGSYRYLEASNRRPFAYIDHFDFLMPPMRYWLIRNPTRVFRQSTSIISSTEIYRLDYFKSDLGNNALPYLFDRIHDESIYASQIQFQFGMQVLYRYRLEYYIQTRVTGTISPATAILLMQV